MNKFEIWVIAFVFIIGIGLIILILGNPIKLIKNVVSQNEENNETGNFSEQKEISEGECPTCGSSSSGGSSSGGGGSSSSSGGYSNNLPADFNSKPCGYYYKEYGACGGVCSKGECINDGRSCYCKLN